MTTTPAILINETEISPVEYENQRVVTFAMIDKVHGRPDDTARRNFRANKNRLIEKEDYYLVDFTQKDVFRPFGIQVPPRGITVLTESGYLLLVKSFTDDLAWQVQRQLVRAYFKTKPESVNFPSEETLTPAEQHELSAVVKAKAEGNGKLIAEVWSRIKNKFKVAKYDQIKRSRFQDAIEYVSDMEFKSAPQAPQITARELIELGELRAKVGFLEEQNSYIRDLSERYRVAHMELLDIVLDLLHPNRKKKTA